MRYTEFSIAMTVDLFHDILVKPLNRHQRRAMDFLCALREPRLIEPFMEISYYKSPVHAFMTKGIRA